MSNAAKNFVILATSLNVLHNYFNNLMELFSQICLAKFLNISTKSFHVEFGNTRRVFLPVIVA